MNSNSFKDLVFASRSSSLCETRDATFGEEYALSAAGGRPFECFACGLDTSDSSPSNSLKNTFFPLLPESGIALRLMFIGDARAAKGDNDLLKFLLFSALSAWKKRSRGDVGGSGAGAGRAASDSGEDISGKGRPVASWVFAEGGRPALGTDLEKNFGTGSEDAAGELEKVGPAYGCSRFFAGVSGMCPPPMETGLVFCVAGPLCPYCSTGRAPMFMLCCRCFGFFFGCGEWIPIATAPSDTAPSVWL